MANHIESSELLGQLHENLKGLQQHAPAALLWGAAPQEAYLASLATAVQLAAVLLNGALLHMTEQTHPEAYILHRMNTASNHIGDAASELRIVRELLHAHRTGETTTATVLAQHTQTGGMW